ncbi:Delphilin [Desmophyllum pertusum]|uniref:Delphilin n=1 Tax=Desmophyllum pertusum TaxID=174260 RepID=A0A9W9ZI89_9CNID|nr:Delphilin [Desmophyllum pertusum]
MDSSIQTSRLLAKSTSAIFSSCSPCPTPTPTMLPPPPPPNTVNGHKRHRLDCRKLSWEQLSPDLLNRDTIWKKVRKHLPLEGIFDSDDIMREFSVVPSSGASPKKAKRENAMHEKKIFNISIVMTHYKLKAEGVAQCLISGTSHLTSDVLRQLLAFAPDEREAIALRKLERENEILLEPAEHFYLQIAASVPSYKERLRTVLLKAQLQEGSHKLSHILRQFIMACQELISSEKLATFIELLLTMGNIMNGSDTCAFKVTFVTKLMDYKSSVNKTTTVLDYLTRVIITKCPHIAALQDDLRHVEQASRVHSSH